MYGLRSDKGIICYSVSNGLLAIADPFDEESQLSHICPIMSGDQLDIDILCRGVTYMLDDYSVVVFKFTAEEELNLVLYKIRGH